MKAKRPTIWDKEHISETLGQIGAGLLGGHNFSDGLGAAAQSISSLSGRLREEQRKNVSYGGPDDQFEITTDAYGNRSVREVPEFAAANKAKRDDAFRMKTAQSPRDVADVRGRVLHGISQLPPAQRAAAYANVIQNAQQYGVDPETMPAQWDDTYGSVAGNMGMTVNQAVGNEQRGAAAVVRQEQGAQRIAQGAARVAQGAERLRKSPPSTRTSKPRSGTLKIGAGMAGYSYLGGDPHNPESWKAN